MSEATKSLATPSAGFAFNLLIEMNFYKTRDPLKMIDISYLSWQSGGKRGNFIPTLILTNAMDFDIIRMIEIMCKI